MVTPVVFELRTSRGRTQRQGPKSANAARSAEYVPYRRRSATGAVRVATGLVGRDVLDTPGGRSDGCVTPPRVG